jgi:predicted RNA binding protein YcfA (HicA-like mRNA interferase family)
MGKGNSGKTWFEDGAEAIKVAEQAGCNVRRGKGDHVDVELPDGSHQTVCDREMCRGLGCKIWKAFKIAGLLVIVYSAYCAFTGSDNLVLDGVNTVLSLLI